MSNYNVKSNHTVSKSNTMESFTEYQGSTSVADHYSGVQSLELVDLKQVHTMKSFSLKISKVKLPT